ncbi:hypothetical protein [Corynebacterium lipophiloflavum]|uniref:Transposase n=1 Tax=Corynebacterium lipophiloflavum (strain ATCC 700352 / DSM 44291 / CCUG 37336 / JCM 10383 / DMMZ 1944) TaxID=525263 RepID=C0XTG8_CORLD|nr:hypothetical protein [Corynebacterium lipophiloflavum]EEI16465.1 hypothetical protein HMPREF0298_1738 [Corynebacterium lipophiloflavum DSM 44291]
MLSEPDGFVAAQLNAANPRWNDSVDQRRRRRDHVAAFMAKSHTLLDDFDTTGNYTACIHALKQLEKHYGMTFPFRPHNNPEANSG